MGAFAIPLHRGEEAGPLLEQLLGRAHAQRRVLMLPREGRVLGSLLGLPGTNVCSQNREKLSSGGICLTVGISEPKAINHRIIE